MTRLPMMFIAAALVWVGSSATIAARAAAQEHVQRHVTTAAQGAANVVPNPGFEQGGCGASTPDICGWQLMDNSSGCQGPTGPCTSTTMYQDSYAHSGSASMALSWGTDFSNGWGGVTASTDPGSCVAIGPGAHPASFWYANASGSEYGVSVAFAATFYDGADCSGTGTYAALSDDGTTDWKQVTGFMIAPPGTQSALFSVTLGTECDYAGGCSVFANLDDLEVDDEVVTTPVISYFTPGNGPVGSSVDIRGANFTGATSVKFNGTAASFTVDSDSELHATVPTGATTGPISVTTSSGSATSSSSFGVAPTISSFAPTCGPAGATIDILGSNFTGATGVTFTSAWYGTQPATFTVASDSEIHAIVPSAATLGSITVETPGGTAASSSSFLGACNSPPAINSLTPNSGPVGTSVDIRGYYFSGATSVKFNGTPAAFTVDSDSEIHATVPNGASTGPVSVTTSNGTANGSLYFTVASPGIKSFSPSSGPIGTTVDILGVNFTGATAVSFNGTAAGFTVDSDSEIHATVPSAATTGPISVTTPSGTATTSSSYTVDAPPNAQFGFTCTALTCSFDGSASTDLDGTIQSYSWNFGDGAKGSGETATHTYAQATSYAVSLVVTDSGGATATTSHTVTLIALSARGYKTNRLEKVDLSWNGSSGASYDVYRNGGKIATVEAGAYTDNINRKGSGTYTYKVCASAGSVCSNTTSVSF